eukprot:4766701-Amphidinium_carterae.1
MPAEVDTKFVVEFCAAVFVTFLSASVLVVTLVAVIELCSIRTVWSCQQHHPIDNLQRCEQSSTRKYACCRGSLGFPQDRCQECLLVDDGVLEKNADKIHEPSAAVLKALSMCGELTSQDSMETCHFLLDCVHYASTKTCEREAPEVQARFKGTTTEHAATLLRLGAAHPQLFATCARILAHVDEEAGNEAVHQCEKNQEDDWKSSLKQVEACAALDRVTMKMNSCSACVSTAWTIVTDVVLPLFDVVSDCLTAVAFFKEAHMKWFAVLLAAMVFYSIAAARLAYKDGQTGLGLADTLTFGTASQVRYAVQSIQEGVKAPAVLSHTRLEGVESLISFFITAH